MLPWHLWMWRPTFVTWKKQTFVATTYLIALFLFVLLHLPHYIILYFSQTCCLSSTIWLVSLFLSFQNRGNHLSDNFIVTKTKWSAKTRISIFKFTPCHLRKRAGQITKKPKGGPLEEKLIFFQIAPIMNSVHGTCRGLHGPKCNIKHVFIP